MNIQLIYPEHLQDWVGDGTKRPEKRDEFNYIGISIEERHGTNFQNRILKGFQMLALMDQYEKQDVILMSEPNALPMQDIDQADDQKDKEGDAK